jgi:hypothetical protein
MKHFFQIAAAAATLFILNPPSIAMAQGTVFTYQGHVTDNGTNFNGSGQFKFALVTASNANFTTYWSNDGTSVNGSEPAAAVSVSVNGGLFTVVLGDTNQPNMAAIDGSLFNRPNLQLRIWFNDGVHGSLALDPPQRLTAAPYAAFANTASNLVNGFTVQANSDGAPNVIGGASLNFVSNGVTGATISGGGASNSGHTNAIYGDFGTVGGGLDNAAGTEATVGGGQGNVAGGGAATVAGGVANTGSGVGSTVSGGFGNMATNDYATVPGGDQNIAGGNVSFAAGFFAQALHRGSFVWSDATLPATPFASTTSNQFSVRANGGVRLITGSAGVMLGSSGQYFATGGTENLRIIRGVVDASGNRIHGMDFSVTRTGVGSYTITFGFSDFPAVTVSAQAGVPRMATTTNVGNSSAQIRIFDQTGALVDAQFHFIAIGPQ